MPYPSMSEVSSVMWCEYDDDDDDDGDDDGSDDREWGRRTPTDSSSSGGNKGRLLRVSVQTLDGHVCDDEDEDSETDDGDSETDNDETDETDDDDGFERFTFNRSLRREQRKNVPRRTSGHTSGGGLRERGRGAGKGGRRTSGVTRNKKEGEFDEVGCQRKEELASVLRRLRVAIRRMDGVLTEEKVRRGSYILPKPVYMAIKM